MDPQPCPVPQAHPPLWTLVSSVLQNNLQNPTVTHEALKLSINSWKDGDHKLH